MTTAHRAIPALLSLVLGLAATGVQATPQNHDREETQAMAQTTREDSMPREREDKSVAVPTQETAARDADEPTSSTASDEDSRAAALPASSATASVQAKFDALDANGDGWIDAGEAAASAALGAQFSALDANKDGKLTLSEFAAASNLAAIRIDTDKAGRHEE